MIFSSLALVAAASLVSSSPSAPAPNEPIFKAYLEQLIGTNSNASVIYRVNPPTDAYTLQAINTLQEYYGFSGETGCHRNRTGFVDCEGNLATNRSVAKNYFYDVTIGIPTETPNDCSIYNATVMDGTHQAFSTSLFSGDGAGHFTQQVGNMSPEEIGLVAQDMSQTYQMTCSASQNAMTCEGNHETLARLSRVRAQCTYSDFPYSHEAGQLLSCAIFKV